MTDLPPVFIIGPRCAGKTTVARLCARRLGCAFADTDALIAAEAGQTVADIVASEGWPGFRRRESLALARAAKPGTVVGTGGGMVLEAANRAFMREAGVVFYLSAPLECLLERMGRGTNKAQRPSLTGGDPAAELARILEERENVYRETAHHCLDASVPAARVADAMVRILAGRSAGAGDGGGAEYEKG